MLRKCVTLCVACFDGERREGRKPEMANNKHRKVKKSKSQNRSAPGGLFHSFRPVDVSTLSLLGVLTFFGLPVAAALGQSVTQWTPPPGAKSDLEEALAEPVDEQLAAQINSALAMLGSPSFKEREAATSRLIEIGPQAFSRLRTAYDESDELEVRLRIETIVREAYFRFHVFERNGFLGISQNRIPVVSDDDERIQPGHVGIKVQNVIKDTAAERAELKKGDVIIALDGEPITVSGVQATVVFGESIRVRRPGARLTLTVLRGPNDLEVEVTLGSRPRLYYRNQGLVTQMLDHFRQQFGGFWVKHFRQPSKEESTDDRP